MEPERIDQEPSFARSPSRLHQVTPLSKYLAMVLFTILPFVGGWIGYTYAPEKIVEVEKVVVKDREVELKDELLFGGTDGQYQITSNPTEALERAKETLQLPAQTAIPDFNLDTDEYPRDMLYPGIGGDGIPKVRLHVLTARNQPINCWVVLNRFVHDITPVFTLVDELPAIELLADECGTDITDFLSTQPVGVGALGTARFKYVLAEFYLPLGVEMR